MKKLRLKEMKHLAQRRLESHGKAHALKNKVIIKNKQKIK